MTIPKMLTEKSLQKILRQMTRHARKPGALEKQFAVPEKARREIPAEKPLLPMKPALPFPCPTQARRKSCLCQLKHLRLRRNLA